MKAVISHQGGRMRFAVAGLFVLGLTGLAGVQAQAPADVTISSEGVSVKDGVRILRDVTIDINGVLITADGAERQNSQMVLQNAKLTIPNGITFKSRFKF
jgi:hypothetical protein